MQGGDGDGSVGFVDFEVVVSAEAQDFDMQNAGHGEIVDGAVDVDVEFGAVEGIEGEGDLIVGIGAGEGKGSAGEGDGEEFAGFERFKEGDWGEV